MVFGNSTFIVNAEEIGTEPGDVPAIEQEAPDGTGGESQGEGTGDAGQTGDGENGNEENGGGENNGESPGTQPTDPPAGGDTQPDVEEPEEDAYYRISINTENDVDWEDMVFGDICILRARLYKEVEDIETEVEGARFEWAISEGEDIISITPDGNASNKCSITAKNKEGEAEIRITAYEGDKELTSTTRYIWVDDGSYSYYRLTAKDIYAHPGAVLSVNDFAPQLKQYTNLVPNGKVVTPQSLKFWWSSSNTVFSYNPNAGTLMVNSNALNGTNGSRESTANIEAYIAGQTGYVDDYDAKVMIHYPNWSGWTTSGTSQTRKCTICGKTESRQAFIRTTANSLKMKVKQKTTAFRATVGAGDAVTSVTSSNKKVLKVSNVKGNGTFKLTALKKGKAKLTITTAYGMTKTVQVTVQAKDVKATKISGLQKKVTLKKGKTHKLSPKLEPVTAKKKITYKTSNKKIATVSAKGVIKAKKPGKAKITVKSGSKKFTVTVVVKK